MIADRTSNTGGRACTSQVRLAGGKSSSIAIPPRAAVPERSARYTSQLPSAPSGAASGKAISDAVQPIQSDDQERTQRKRRRQRPCRYSPQPRCRTNDPRYDSSQHHRSDNENRPAVDPAVEQCDSPKRQDGEKQHPDNAARECAHSVPPSTISINCRAVFRNGPHQGQRGHPDQKRHALRRQFQQARRPGLIRRFVDHPKENHAHLKEPQHARQARLQVARNPHAAIHQNAAKPCQVDVADLLRLRAERRQRMPGVRAVAQQRAQHSTIRCEVFQLHANQLAQPLLQSAPRLPVPLRSSAASPRRSAGRSPSRWHLWKGSNSRRRRSPPPPSARCRAWSRCRTPPAGKVPARHPESGGPSLRLSA